MCFYYGDTEIFMLSFFQYTFPEAAKHLLEYRYRGLEGARIKAAQYGYRGAMYPWETANGQGGDASRCGS